MFFMIAVTNGRKDLSYNRMIICRSCGAYGRYQVYMTFMQLLLFFIPCFRWNRQYYVQMSCCGALYQLDPGIGRRIERGEDPEIADTDLTPLSGASCTRIRTCAACGYSTSEDFAYCPKCGRPF